MNIDLITQREKEVATLMVQGLSNTEIADVLGISIHTVKLHTTKLMKKLGTINRAHTAYTIGCMDNKNKIIISSIKVYADIK